MRVAAGRPAEALHPRSPCRGVVVRHSAAARAAPVPANCSEIA
jgi:hypothetical protein